MRRDDAIARLKAAEPELRALGIGALYLFGSVARDEADETSDVDVFVDFRPDAANVFRGFMAARRTLDAALQNPLHMMSRDGVHPRIRSSVEAQAIRIF